MSTKTKSVNTQSSSTKSTNAKTPATVKLIDPREAYPKPPFKNQQPITSDATTAKMDPQPDHGEQSYCGSGKLQGLCAIITGGDSGIGRAIAIAYAREGANVIINYHTSEDDAQTTVKLIEEAGTTGVAIQGDLREESFCESLIDEAITRFGRLDILINNAAYQQTRDSLEDFSTEVFDRVFKTNVYATFWLSRAAVTKMTPGGSIIITVSIQGYTPSPELLPYSASKSALLGMTKGMAKLAMKNGVRVNAVAPGPVWTPLIPSTVDIEKAQNFGADTIFERPAQPAELAPLYVWLASPEASYVSAEVFGATGGRTPV